MPNQRIFLKLVIIAVLVLISLIPLGLITLTIDERESRRDDVQDEAIKKYIDTVDFHITNYGHIFWFDSIFLKSDEILFKFPNELNIQTTINKLKNHYS